MVPYGLIPVWSEEGLKEFKSGVSPNGPLVASSAVWYHAIDSLIFAVDFILASAIVKNGFRVVM